MYGTHAKWVHRQTNPTEENVSSGGFVHVSSGVSFLRVSSVRLATIAIYASGKQNGFGNANEPKTVPRRSLSRALPFVETFRAPVRDACTHITGPATTVTVGTGRRLVSGYFRRRWSRFEHGRKSSINLRSSSSSCGTVFCENYEIFTRANRMFRSDERSSRAFRLSNRFSEYVSRALFYHLSTWNFNCLYALLFLLGSATLFIRSLRSQSFVLSAARSA